MKKLTLACCGVAALGALVLPAVGTAGDPAYAPKDCVKPKIAPGRIVVTCADGNFYLKIREWKYFNGHSATLVSARELVQSTGPLPWADGRGVTREAEPEVHRFPRRIASYSRSRQRIVIVD